MSSQFQLKANQIPVVPDAFELVDGRPHLVGTKCSKCGASFFPPRVICTNCLTDATVSRAVLGHTGTLYAFTVIHIAAKEFNPPYPFGYVILEPEKIRVPTLITGVDDFGVLRTGMKMEMVIEKLREDSKGNEIITFKFRPAAEA
ncbi:MAG: zinc ribbon domain-containing protein [Thermodesulfobacteriota bacterium]